jgi:hypothetical protein
MTVVAVALAWLAWGLALVATLVPRTVGLTAVRVLVPAAFAAAVAVTAYGDADAIAIVAIGWTAALAAVTLFVPALTDAFVDGSSYGPERRMALRVPGTLLLAPAPLTWAATVGGLAIGPLLLAAKVWVAGVLVTVAGVLAAWFGVRALHQLSRRWIVFTPAGVVLHDTLIAGDVILFPKAMVVSITPARADTTATDVSGRALGLVLELRLTEPSKVRGTTTDRLLFSPVRPGALLHEARMRGLTTSPPPSTSSPS